MCYRWALKGTSLLFSPLVWLSHHSFASELWDRLLDLRDFAFHRAVRAYSSIALLVLGGRVALDVVHPAWPRVWEGHPSASLFDAIAAPHRWPAWQIAMLINAFAAWGLYFVADGALKRKDRGRPRDMRFLDRFIRTIWFIRGALSLFVIGNGILAAAAFAGVRIPLLHG
ncbi:MAG TPA: hypothetical protein VK447_03070 [Myxococcaceae bacterium]|nr:hypothetical protein [Myxococcaceae bacterium]